MFFKYKAINNNSIIKNVIIADNEKEALIYLRKNNYNVFYIKKINQNVINFKKFSLYFFIKKIQLMLFAGMSLQQSLKLLSNTQNMILNNFSNILLQKINNGDSFSNALNYFPNFNKMYISLIKIGEESCDLKNVLNDILIIEKQKEKLLKKINISIVYPKLIFIIVLFFLFFGYIYLIPNFEKLFQNNEMHLPFITIIVFKLFKLLPLLFFLFVICYIIFKYILYIKEKIKVILDKYIFKIPFLKTIFYNFYMYNISFSIYIMLKNGINLNNSLDILYNNFDNIYIQKILKDLIININKGQSLSNSIKNNMFFDKDFFDLILTGEETGNLKDILISLSEFYKDEFNNSIDLFLELLQPILIIMLGLVVIPIILAIYLPILDMSTGSFLNL